MIYNSFGRGKQILTNMEMMAAGRKPALSIAARLGYAGVMRRSPLRFVLSAAVLAGLAGCKLVDQTTFAPRAYGPGPAQVAQITANSARIPLVTIRLPARAADYRAPLAGAVRAAEARKPDVAFDVVAVAPGATAADLRPATAAAAEVMRAIGAMGVPDARLALGAQSVPGSPGPEVRVYVR